MHATGERARVRPHNALLLTDRLRMRFWSKVDRSPGLGPQGDCWEWTAAYRDAGYGAIKINRQVWDAHRAAWLIANGGEIAAGLMVCHKCDNRRCVRPDHLFLEDNSGNMRDAASKGRLPLIKRGREFPRSVLTEEIVRAARRMHRRGWSVVKLASHFGVNRWTLLDALRGITWQHVR